MKKLTFDTHRLEVLYKAGHARVKEAARRLPRPGQVIRPRRQIEVKQLGLATGQVVPVRREPSRRRQIKVKYIPT